MTGSRYIKSKNYHNIRPKRQLVFTNLEVALLMIPTAIIGKLLRYFVMSEKLLDNSSGSKILKMMLDTDYSFAFFDAGSGDSFSFTAGFFRAINIFGFDTQLQWEIFLSVVFNLICISFVLICTHYIDLRQCVFFLASAGILNIFVFNLGKDVLQFLLFSLVFLALRNRKTDYRITAVIVSLILVGSGFLFRLYYILMALFLVLIVFAVYPIVKRIKNRIAAWCCGALLVYAVLALALFAGSILFPSVTSTLINIKADTLNNLRQYSSYPDTPISNFVSGSGVLAFILNHFISVVRMILPLELLLKGVKYIPFLLFLILVLVGFIYAVIVINKSSDNKSKSLLPLFVFISFVLCSAVFEPDFGSWTRHEIAVFPVLYFIFDAIYIEKANEPEKERYFSCKAER